MPTHRYGKVIGVRTLFVKDGAPQCSLTIRTDTVIEHLTSGRMTLELEGAVVHECPRPLFWWTVTLPHSPSAQGLIAQGLPGERAIPHEHQEEP